MLSGKAQHILLQVMADNAGQPAARSKMCWKLKWLITSCNNWLVYNNNWLVCAVNKQLLFIHSTNQPTAAIPSG